MRIRAALTATALALGGSLVFAPSASAASWYVDTHKACNPNKYHVHYTATSSAKNPVLTHLQVYGMPPNASHTVTKTVAHATTLAASVKYSSSLSLSASGAARIFVKASASAKISLAARGSHTASGSTKVTDTIRNPTSKNAAFVFYAGDTSAKGTFRHYFCEQTHPYSAYSIRYSPGKWTSYGVHGDGAARCGIAGVTTLQKLALKVGCK